MTIFAEMERTSEWGFIKDSTTYTKASGAWSTLHDFGNVTLATDGIVAFAIQYAKTTGAGTGNVRVKIGSNYVVGGEVVYPDPYRVIIGYVWLPAGTYDVLVEARASSNNTSMIFFALGYVLFNDTKYSALQSGGGAAITVNLSKVVARMTPVGLINKQNVFIQVCAYQSDAAATKLLDVGESDANGVSLSVDGSAVSWHEKFNDPASFGCAYGSYQIGGEALADHVIVVTPTDTTHTVMTVSVIACPWLFTKWMLQPLPVAMSFSQFSTLYVWLEALILNPTKNFYIGSQKKCVSYGTAADYYYTTSGVDILVASYTFEALQLGSILAWADGYGGCISLVAVDAR